MRKKFIKRMSMGLAAVVALAANAYAVNVKMYDECVSVSGTIKAAKSGEKVTVSVLPQGESWDGISQTGEIQKDFIPFISELNLLKPPIMRTLYICQHRHIKVLFRKQTEILLRYI